LKIIFSGILTLLKLKYGFMISFLISIFSILSSFFSLDLACFAVEALALFFLI